MTSQLRVRVPQLEGARALFTSSADGNLALHVNDNPEWVLANRRALEEEIGRRVIFADQVHSAEVCTIVSGEDRDRALREPPRVDALVTNRSDIALAMMSADCVPLVLSDHRAAVVGAVHAGRVGLMAGVIGNAVEAMCSLGAKPETMSVLIGPSICGECYEVEEELQRSCAELLHSVSSATTWGTPALDLRAGAEECAVVAGVPAQNLTRIDRCTFESPDQFSYRRDKNSGRFAGVIYRTTANL